MKTRRFTASLALLLLAPAALWSCDHGSAPASNATSTASPPDPDAADGASEPSDARSGSPPGDGGQSAEGGGDALAGGSCGNGHLDPGEACDGSDLGGLECTDFAGFAAGAAGCRSDCGALVLSSCVRGNEISAASANYDDVNTAVANANDGDTVRVPAGRAVWSSTLAIRKSILLQGAGANAAGTLIVRDSGFTGTLVEVAPPKDVAVRVSGFSFDNAGHCDTDTPAVAVVGRSFAGNGSTLTKVRIDHDAFATGKRAVYWSGWAYGVTDHDAFTNCNIAVGLQGDDDFAWERPIAPGTKDAIVLEDNTFHIDDGIDCAPDQQTYHQEGTRSVIRFNDFDGSMYHSASQFSDAHGNQNYYTGNTHGDFRGTILREVYGNTFHALTTYEFGNSRAGSLLAFDNTFICDTCSSSNPPAIFTLTEEEGWQSFFGDPHRTAWPAEDQVNATFFWNNTYNGKPVSSANIVANAHTNDSTFIQEGRDFWMKKPDPTTYTVYPDPGPPSTGYPNRYVPITSYTPLIHPHPLANP